jgi:hypothetical protein
MGYSKSKNSFLRVEPVLVLLAKTEDNIFIPSNTPRDLLYKIREGLLYAEEHKVEPYDKLKEKFILKEKKEGIEVKLRRQIHFEAPIKLLAKSQNLVIEAATGVLDIIGACIMHKAPRIEFPRATNIEGNGIINLENYASKNNYKITQSKPFVIMERVDINAVQESGAIEG